MPSIDARAGRILSPSDILSPAEKLVARERRFQQAVGEAGIMATRALIALPPLPPDIRLLPKRERKAAIKEHVEAADNAANATLVRHFNQMPDRIKAEGEGGKDQRVNGYQVEEGTGVFGNPDAEEEWTVEHDPVEGTELFVFGEPNAWTVLASAKSIAQHGSDYVEKLAGPRGLEGKWSLDASVDENLRVLLGEMRRANPNRPADPTNIMVTVLDRPRNERIIREIIQFGARANLIQAGDCIPVSRIAQQNLYDKYIEAMMGVGGGPETKISAVMAGLLRGFFQAREALDEDPAIRTYRNPILGYQQLVPDGFEGATVVMAPLTRDNLHDHEGVRGYEDGSGTGHEIDVLTIDQRGRISGLLLPFRLPSDPESVLFKALPQHSRGNGSVGRPSRANL